MEQPIKKSLSWKDVTITLFGKEIKGIKTVSISYKDKEALCDHLNIAPIVPAIE